MDEHKYTFTIIIPHYGIPSRLVRLLQSIPRRVDLQIIVVDDCSPQEGIDFLNYIRKNFEYVEYYTTPYNGGGGLARNIGLSKAIGKYVIFADADDFFLPSLNEILDKYKESYADMVIFNALSLDDVSYKLSNRSTHLNKYIDLFKLDSEKGLLNLRYLFGEPWCRIIKREIITSNNIRFRECRVHNDTYFSYTISFYCKDIIIEDTVAYIITNRVNSVSKTSDWSKQELAVDVFAEKNRFLEEKNIRIFDSLIFNPFIKCIKQSNWNELKKLKVIIKKYDYSMNTIFFKFLKLKIQSLLKLKK